MPVIVPQDTSNNILALLADPKAVKANIQELQTMAEQYQRDAKKARAEQDKLSELKNSLQEKEANQANLQAELDSKHSALISYHSDVRLQSEQNERDLASLNDLRAELSDKEKELSKREKAVAKHESDMKEHRDNMHKERTHLAHDKDKHAAWLASINSTLLSRP